MNNFSYMRTGALLVLAGFVGACASSQDAMVSDAAEPEVAFEQPEFSADEETLNVINDVVKLNQIALVESCAWAEAGDMIVDAQDALDAGDAVTALSMADEAKRVVEDELINCIGEVPDLMAMAEGEAMMDADAVAAEVEYGDIISYSVGTNDSLWSIAGRDDIYSDPYMWPLIYKLNSDQIEDPDLIFPEQVFLIEANPLEHEVDNAILHAQKRGEWSLEDLEFTDAEYLRL
jgi:hypothetical protein